MKRRKMMGNIKQGRRAKRIKRRRLAVRFGLLFLLILGVINCVGFVSRLSIGAGNFLGEKTDGNGIGSYLEMSSFSEGIYPDSLIELAKNNPETRQFVKGYPNFKKNQKKNDSERIDVSKDLTGGIPLFLQWDERWGYRQYGGDFMAVNGCGPACLSMVWCGLTGEGKWNPYKVAVMAEQNGYYVKGQGSSWDLMMSGAAQIGLLAETVPFDETHILETLRQGKPIICVMGPGDFTTQGHFLVLTGVDADGKILVHDPNSRKRSGRSWEIKRLMSQIKNLWTYRV